MTSCKLLKACEVDSLDIKYNSMKSAVVICRNSYVRNVTFSKFNIGDTIEEVPFVLYVRHFICNDMRDDMHIMIQCRQIYAERNILVSKFNMCSNIVNWVTLFSTYCSFRCLFRLPRDCSASGMFAQNRACAICPLLRYEVALQNQTTLDESINV